MLPSKRKAESISGETPSSMQFTDEQMEALQKPINSLPAKSQNLITLIDNLRREYAESVTNRLGVDYRDFDKKYFIQIKAEFLREGPELSKDFGKRMQPF